MCWLDSNTLLLYLRCFHTIAFFYRENTTSSFCLLKKLKKCATEKLNMWKENSPYWLVKIEFRWVNFFTYCTKWILCFIMWIWQIPWKILIPLNPIDSHRHENKRKNAGGDAKDNFHKCGLKRATWILISITIFSLHCYY